MSKDKPPEFQDLKEEYQDYALHTYNLLRQRQAEHEALYEQTVDLGLKGKAFQHPTHTPDAMLIVDDPADHLAMDKIIVDQYPRPSKGGGEKKEAKEQADKNAKWMQAYLDENKRNEPYFYRELIHNLAYRGEAFGKLDIHWDTLQDQEKYPGPVMDIVVPDSVMVYASLNIRQGVPDSVFEEKVATVKHVMECLEEWNVGKDSTLSTGKRKDSDLVYMIEWYKGKWMGYLVADIMQQTSRFWLQPITFQGDIVAENPLGHPPFIRGFSGLGTVARDGDPVHPCRGILTGIERVLIGKSRSYTKMDTLTSKYALPIPVMDTIDGYVLSEEELDFSAGVAKQTSQNTIKKIEYLNPPAMPQAQLSQLSEQDRVIESYRPSVTRGVPLPGEPASSLATRLGLAVLKWEPIKTSGVKAVTRLCEMALEVVDIAGKKGWGAVEIAGMSLSSDEVNGYYRAEIDIEPGSQEQLRFDIFTALQLWDKIPNPEWIIQKFLHEANATQFLLDMHTEEARKEMMKDPVYRTAFFTGVFELAGMKAEQKRLQDMVDKGELPGTASPGAMGGAMGEAMAPGGNGGPPSATPPGAGGSPGMGAVSLPGTHQQPVEPAMGG